MARRGADTIIFHEAGRILENPASLSSQKEATINNITKVKKKTNPIGVRRVRILLLLVVALYKALINFSGKLIILEGEFTCLSYQKIAFLTIFWRYNFLYLFSFW
ncbi:MAG: hypothetical protein A3I39_01350 [Candidatus Yanofskybacteria bacterium RIFCSPLOWO2_02_FULL_47_9b]|uniref:Uncharacterized protein n=1 Tax=Candidatus Yanofskybacteria bacterium RIFCSPLOWO2_02_FULL_47_9b TaxID=1802708 RepID=A0A1F8HBH4_9BACT|nr:MAG: hypothetical protein A3I39_01350 [Candidatus Yanofskybacteria bacterium RIFCSPLOWO2_02_FULL_47_9b]